MPRPPLAVVLDFDGVILQSVDIKTRAFEALFRHEAPDHASRIVAYHRANGGISRFEKFRWAYKEVLRRELTPVEERALGERFNAFVEDAVATCPFVPGALEFLNEAAPVTPLFVASGTPEEELRRIVERRGLRRFFKGVHGAPARKASILRSTAGALRGDVHDLVMVGDALNDLDAAAEAGARFIGIVAGGGRSPFPEGTPVLPDLRRLKAALDES